MTSISQLESMLRRQSRATAIGVTLISPPDMPKRGNPFHGRVLKVATFNGLTGVSYSRSVNNQRWREQRPLDARGQVKKFQAAKRAFGNVIEGTPLLEHVAAGTGQTFLYLRMKVQLTRPPLYFDEKTGERIDVTELQPWLRGSDATRRQEVQYPVKWRTPRLDHIARIRMLGTEYTMRSHVPMLRMFGLEAAAA